MIHQITLAIVAIGASATIQPTATRPTPERVIVVDADYAWVEQSQEVYGITTGIRIIDSLVWEDGTIEYLVNPTADITVQAFGPDDLGTPEVDRQQVEIQMPVTLEGRLDWVIYNRVKWERELADFVAAEGNGYFQIMDSIARVQLMLEEEGN